MQRLAYFLLPTNPKAPGRVRGSLLALFLCLLFVTPAQAQSDTDTDPSLTASVTCDCSKNYEVGVTVPIKIKVLKNGVPVPNASFEFNGTSNLIQTNSFINPGNFDTLGTFQTDSSGTFTYPFRMSEDLPAQTIDFTITPQPHGTPSSFSINFVHNGPYIYSGDIFGVIAFFVILSLPLLILLPVIIGGIAIFLVIKKKIKDTQKRKTPL